MLTPSEGFVSSLRAYDPLLSVRWGDYVGRWVVERKAYITDTELWFLQRRVPRFLKRAQATPHDAPKYQFYWDQYNEIREELKAAQGGKRVVFMPKELNRLAFDTLGIMDIRRWGGYSRMADEIESRESRSEADQERVMSNEREALNKHVYDILDFAWRKRSTQLANGEHLRRSLKDIIGTSEL